MKTGVRQLASLPALLWLVTTVATPAHAQFEEPDTIPRFAVGATAEAVFRGKRGETPGGDDISFGGGPAFGVRLEYRLSPTLGIAAAGSYASPQETVGAGSNPDGFTMLQFSGELMLRVKPNIPGFFILGGGARYTDASGSDPNSQWHNVTSFTDPMGIVGAGIELGRRQNRMFKIDFRLYLVAPSEQVAFETKSMEIDFGIDVALLFRF